MKEEEKLLNINIEKTHQKQSFNSPEGIKLYIFRALYSILQNEVLNEFINTIFIIVEFIQLMAFPMDTVFSSGWKNYLYSTIGSFFRYFQLLFLWKGNTPIYLITYIITVFYIVVILIGFIHIIIRSSSISYVSKYTNKLISILIEFEIILNIPFLRTLFSVYICEKDFLEVANDIKCKSGIHICLMVISVLLIFIFIILFILFHITLFEYGVNNDKLKAAYTSSTEVLLEITKFILIILFQFIKNELSLSIITFFISLILLINFLYKEPFSNGFTMKLYLLLYLLFFWSNAICMISILLKKTKFEGGVLLLLLGYPLIIISISFTSWDFSFDKLFHFINNKEKDGYKALLEIEYFLKLEDNLEDKIRTKEQKILYSYIMNFESECTNINCPLKQFMKIPLKVENFVEMKIYLLQHGEMLYKNALTKFPFNAKLRLSYGLFLFNKMHKKLQGINEITLLNKLNANLEDSFLIYKAQRYIQEDHEGLLNINNNSNQNSNSNFINSAKYKSTLNNVKSLLGKLAMNYVDFWTILALSDENKSSNFQKMSQIGTKISKLSEELKSNIEKLEIVNLYDIDTFKLYIQYLNEVLSNNTQASIYINKISENDQQKHQYNDENLFELNYNIMSKCEDYKYIVINCSPSNFNSICNLSLSICSIFGYSKEELIGHPYDYLLPELFCIYHKNDLQKKVDDFKKILLIKNTKSHSDSWTEESYIRNKMKYIVPIKIRWNLVSTEEEIIYAIGKIIIENKTPFELEKEIVYILTNNNLIIQSFTPNAAKLLFLQTSAINNNLDITEYIKEFNEDYISNIDNLENIKESYISSNSNNNIKNKERYIKREILKNMFLGEKDTKKVIHWKLGDIITNEINKGKKNELFEKRSSFTRINLLDNKFQSAVINNSGKNLPHCKIKAKRKTSMGTSNKIDNEYPNYKRLSSSHTAEEKLPIYEQEKLIDSNISDFNAETSYITNDKTSKDRIFYQRQIHHKFNLSVKEVKINNAKVGYIFQFEPYSSQLIEEGYNLNTNRNSQYISKYDLSSLNKQDINNFEKNESFMSFAGNKQQPLEHKNSMHYNYVDNPFGLTCENNDVFIKNLNNEIQKEFTIDMNKKSFKQIGINDKSEKIYLYESLRKEAVDKVSKAAKQIKKDQISEEEVSSSGTYSDSEDDNSKNTSEISSNKNNEEESSHQSIKDVISQDIKSQKIENNINNDKNKKSIISLNNNIPTLSISSKNTGLNINLLNNNNVNKNKEEDYYHVNFSKITYYVYNYKTGFVEAIKDQKYKISQVVKQTISEKEKWGKINPKYIVNPKLVKEKKRGINKKIVNDSNEINVYNEQTIKLKEIQKALTSKEKQLTIINLCIFSFIIFLLIIGTGIMSIMINNYLKNQTFLFYNLLKRSILLYKNILFEISFVREMIIIDNTYYNNFVDPDKYHYYSDYSIKCYEYYLDSAFLISNLTTTINTLNEKQKDLIANYKITCYVLSRRHQNDTVYNTTYYDLSIYNAFRELNSALYHISQLKIEEIYTYDDNVYYFIKNGMSNLLISSEKQIKLLRDEFINTIKKGHNIIIICFMVLLFLYVGCFFIFNYFYEKVEQRKQSYLSVFYEIGTEFIILSLTKCEKFLQRLQIQEENLGAQMQIDKKSLDDYSSNDDYDIDPDIHSSSFVKQNKENKININKEKNIKNILIIKSRIFISIIFFMLLIFQYSSYIYYYLRLSLYKNCTQYEYHLTDYMSNFIFPFIGIREYIYDKHKSFYNIYVERYIDDTLFSFYINLAKVSAKKDEYLTNIPNSYSQYLTYLYSDHICELITDFINKFPNNGYADCKDFFYGSSNYGFFSILTMYIEEIRYLRDVVNDYISEAQTKNYIYNESFFNDPNRLYQKHYSKYSDVIDDYKQLNPANTLHSHSHKTIFIVYRFIITKVITLVLNHLFLTFEDIFSITTKISLIINIVFIVVVTIGFSILWVPYVLKENETIFKTKNMLSIIPNEILITLPHINNMLGIDRENR